MTPLDFGYWIRGIVGVGLGPDEIDAGRQFDGMILIYSLKDLEKKQTMTGMMRSQYGIVEALGVIECVKYDLMQGNDA